MRLLNPNNNWQILIDFPETLQFIAYIGQQEDFRLSNKAQAGSVLEADWQRWWKLYPDTYGYNPPDFRDLRNEPGIRTLYLKHWPAFWQKWSQTKMGLVEQQQAQLNRLEIQNLVRVCQKEAGRASPDFELKITFVWWPENYRDSLSEKQLILGTGYLQAAKLAELSELLKDQLKKLI